MFSESTPHKIRGFLVIEISVKGPTDEGHQRHRSSDLFCHKSAHIFKDF
jgi:hypothetical protein